MADAARRVRLTVGLAQLLLVVAAGTLWAASRLTWVTVRSFDGLGQPKEVALSGVTWSTALLPLAIVNLAAAIAALAVRGWQLRALAVLLAASSFAVGYLGVSLWAVPDVAARGADLAHVPVATLVGSGRQYTGAVITVVAAVCTLLAATLLMRASTAAPARSRSTKYLAPGARRSMARDDTPSGEPKLSERTIWDALDAGRDPTDGSPEADTEGR
ncbi:TIGR02234 family membrane protein [Mycobacterium vicinigordonae]|uniref:TIGR02234 family membrane protein n=1 Tax=Mycobacterium vicinigordonae TaxID=1719132 RepID=A0A7D6E8J9_9MYCO|nr:TIGR02234 family membrane protein [Mycobacterium vicinigordonae]QLL09702.1 TIGR02234 family membrane protein [Mycobacterium vicinigordonae]